jgi:hypothetical protein
MSAGEDSGPKDWHLLFGFPAAAGAFGLVVGALHDLTNGDGMHWGATLGAAIVIAVIAFVVIASILVGSAIGEQRTEARKRARERAATRSIDGLASLDEHDRARWQKLARGARRRSRATGVALILGAPVLALLVAALQVDAEGVSDASEAGIEPLAGMGIVIALLAGLSTLVFGLVRGVQLLRPRVYLMLGQIHGHTSEPLDGGFELTEFESSALDLDVAQCHRIAPSGELKVDDRYHGRQRFKGRASVVEVIPVGQIVAIVVRRPGDRIVAVL